MKKTKAILMMAVIAAVIIQTSTLNAQDDKSKRPSPPAQTKATIGETEIVINYSQPAVKGRAIWGELVPYGKVWRTGANEATTFETSSDLMIEGKTLKAGKYSLFTIPGENEWIFIFNSNSEQWGSFSYDKSKDVLRVTGKPGKLDESMERFTIDIEGNGEVVLKWANLKAGFMTKGA